MLRLIYSLGFTNTASMILGSCFDDDRVASVVGITVVGNLPLRKKDQYPK